ncbi:hypothetical protein C8Q76DRAFT_338968 [Earliella scabrosa]|nr:hypothetical protein C8Q76DRAFT_338968 [Earliella scabrosa]
MPGATQGSPRDRPFGPAVVGRDRGWRWGEERGIDPPVGRNTRSGRPHRRRPHGLNAMSKSSVARLRHEVPAVRNDTLGVRAPVAHVLQEVRSRPPILTIESEELTEVLLRSDRTLSSDLRVCPRSMFSFHCRILAKLAGCLRGVGEATCGMTCRALAVDAVPRAAFFCCTRKARSSVTASSAMWKALAGAIGRNKAVVGGWSAPSQGTWIYGMIDGYLAIRAVWCGKRSRPRD